MASIVVSKSTGLGSNPGTPAKLRFVTQLAEV